MYALYVAGYEFLVQRGRLRRSAAGPQAALRSATVEHATQRLLLGAGDIELPLVLDVDPGASVRAPVRGVGGLPLVRGSVALGLVDGVVNGDELLGLQVVGEGL